jgi:hypothetical protein
MKHLETKRDAAERRRLAMMRRGISKFLEGKGEPVSTEPSITENDESPDEKPNESGNVPIDIQVTDSKGATVALNPSERRNDTTLDKIKLTLDHAAEVLRESLEITAGGVVFLDTAICYSDVGETAASSTANGVHRGENSTDEVEERPSLTYLGDKDGRSLSRQSVRTSDDQHKSTRILATSAAPMVTWDHKTRVLDCKTLHRLIDSYPKGNIWYIDDESYFSSLEQINELASSIATSSSERRPSVLTVDLTKQYAEATMLSQIFHRARQIMFLPLWDACGGTLRRSTVCRSY